MEKENLKNFIKNNFYHVSSQFFLEKFINMIQSVSKTTYNDTALFEFEIIFDEKASNFLNIFLDLLPISFCILILITLFLRLVHID